MRSLLVTCILIGLAAVAAPHLFKKYIREPEAAANVAAKSESTESILPGSAEDESAEATPSPTVAAASSRQVEIKAERDGHFYVDAEINSRPVRLMVDTGATVVALRASDAAAAGIRPAKADFTNPVQTANGTTMAAQTVLDSIVVDDIEVRNIRALVVPDEQLSLSLLGGSFLNGLERFEVADGTLIFED